MISNRILAGVLILSLSLGTVAFSAKEAPTDFLVPSIEPLDASWTFSGTVTNESGDKYGYFFQMQRQGSDFHVKTALVNGQSNQLVLFYENQAVLTDSKPFNWHVGSSFMRFNPINDSWIFGAKLDEGKGFNFKVDMLQQANQSGERLVLRPGVELEALQTSRLNGHIKINSEQNEEFVTGNNAWFGKVWFSKKQKAPHKINTTFCRLSNDNGFYSANLKEADATGAAVAGWRDPSGKKIKMSQFVSIKSLEDNQCLLHVGLPRLSLTLKNTLTSDKNMPLFVAGFSKNNPKSFCFVDQLSFHQTFNNEAIKPVVG
jgi:hypothetical protein